MKGSMYRSLSLHLGQCLTLTLHPTHAVSRAVCSLSKTVFDHQHRMHLYIISSKMFLSTEKWLWKAFYLKGLYGS